MISDKPRRSCMVPPACRPTRVTPPPPLTLPYALVFGRNTSELSEIREFKEAAAEMMRRPAAQARARVIRQVATCSTGG